MLRKAGASPIVSSDPEVIAAADKLLLPGVGHFDHAMRKLRSSGLENVISEFALVAKKPVLGICLGAQILGKGSEEGTEQGLGWINMVCNKLPSSPQIRVPHMGWNELKIHRECKLLVDSVLKSRYYFVHSYYIECVDVADVVATSKHGVSFASVVQKDNIFGMQFHPEKSLRHGLAIMRAFYQL